MLALGMRRPDRLHKSNANQLFPNERDLGVEVILPQFTSVPRKRAHFALFIMLCKLSNIMEDIAVFQRTVKFSYAWNNGATVGPQELQSVMAFDQALKSWRRALDGNVIGAQEQRNEHSGGAMVYVLQIMSE
jgi:hypothetical protein